MSDDNIWLGLFNERRAIESLSSSELEIHLKGKGFASEGLAILKGTIVIFNITTPFSSKLYSQINWLMAQIFCP